MTKYAQLIDGQMIRDAYAPTQPGYGPDRDLAWLARYVTST